MTHGIHKHFTEMQRGRNAQDRRYLATVTDAAYMRMRDRTAKEQLAAAMRELERGPDEVIPDADDSSLRGVFR